MKQEIEDAIVRERARIARELHDELGSALAATSLALAALQRSGARLDPRAERHLVQLGNALAHCTQAKRRLMRVLWADVALDLDLAQSLETLCHELRSSLGLTIHLRIRSQARCSALPVAQAHAAYRVVQEALTNVARHARSPIAWVSVAAIGSRLRVRVRDKGCGFDPRMTPVARQGLLGMRARVVELQGRLDLQSSPGAGTLVQAEWPLPAKTNGLDAEASNPLI